MITSPIRAAISGPISESNCIFSASVPPSSASLTGAALPTLFKYFLCLDPPSLRNFWISLLRSWQVGSGWPLVRQRSVSVAEIRMKEWQHYYCDQDFTKENSKRGYIPPKTETKCTSTERPSSPLDFHCTWFMRSSVITAFIQVAIQIDWVLLSRDKLIKWQTYNKVAKNNKS